MRRDLHQIELYQIPPDEKPHLRIIQTTCLQLASGEGSLTKRPLNIPYLILE